MRLRWVVLAGTLSGCLSVPEPERVTGLGGAGEVDGGADGDAGGASEPTCARTLSFDAPDELATWQAIDTGSCSCGVDGGQLRFSNPGSACDCYFQDPATRHDLRDATIELRLADRRPGGLGTAFTIIFASNRSLFFASARGRLYFGQCAPGQACDVDAYGSRAETPANQRWRFAREGDAIHYQVSADGAAWETAAVAPLVDHDRDEVWLQLGSFESLAGGVLDEVAVDDLRVCDR